MIGTIDRTDPGADHAGHLPDAAPAEERRTELARRRSATRRDRSREHLVPGVNGRPYAMRLDPATGLLVDDLEHGTESTYTNRLCRCTPCNTANADAKAKRAPWRPRRGADQ